MNFNNFAEALVNWIKAADSGGVRRERALRGALAALTAWLVAHYLLRWLTGEVNPAPTLYALVVCAIATLVVVDPKRHDRLVSLLIGGGSLLGALLLAALSNPVPWVFQLLLLALIFVAFSARRYSLRAGETTLLLLMGFYFAHNANVQWINLHLFALAVVIGVGSLLLWQFVLMPYNPARALRNTIRAFSGQAADVLASVAAAVEAPPAAAGVALPGLERDLKRIKVTRFLIESQFPGVLAPGGWGEGQIGQLHLALFGAEQGLSNTVDGVRNLVPESPIPAEFRTAISQALRLLQAALADSGADNLARLSAEGKALQEQVRSQVQKHRLASATQGAAAEIWRAPWVTGALELAGGSYQIALSIAQVKAIETHSAPPPAPAPAATSGKTPALPALAPMMGGLRLHPTTLLGIQAVLATGLSMLLVWLLNIDHGNWVFWTSLLVITGSTGESLRRMLLRVVGTVSGVFVGVGVATIAPDGVFIAVVLLTVFVFLTIFFEPYSYPLMVFCLSAGFVVVYTLAGGSAIDVLHDKIMTTVLGSIVAAVTVLYIFPIRITDRFIVAATRFLNAVDAYVAAFVDMMIGSDNEEARAAALAQVTTTYALVERTLPSVLLENNLLQQSTGLISRQTSMLAALESEVNRLADAASAYDPATADNRNGQILRRLQSTIHNAIQAISGVQRAPTASAPAPVQTTRPGAVAAEGSGLEVTGGAALFRIQSILAQLAVELTHAQRHRVLRRAQPGLS